MFLGDTKLNEYLVSLIYYYFDLQIAPLTLKLKNVSWGYQTQ
jgi:hypothetical protein